MTPEGKVKKAVIAILVNLKKAGYPISYFMPVPTGYGKKGKADFVCCINGYYLEIETKTEGEELTPLQEFNKIKIVNAGGIHITFTNAGKSAELLEIQLRYLCGKKK